MTKYSISLRRVGRLRHPELISPQSGGGGGGV